jgi:hypothetical protein
MKGKRKVDGEVGLIFIAYLFTRMRNILGIGRLMEAMACLISHCKSLNRAIKGHVNEYWAMGNNYSIKSQTYLYSLNNSYIY